MDIYQESLEYHRKGRPGKIEVVPTKPTNNQHDLSLAYSPGVAQPCLEIEKDSAKSFEYTARGNLIAVISNGTAVLGLGNIGAEASKPVMEGKGVLFKRFADIDVFDLEVDETDPDKFVEIVASLGKGFGGINLEDIKAPDCYWIEKKLRERMDIPVFHDDQHGTAIIAGAALLNALEIVNKKIEEIEMVVSGAGAAAISCARLLKRLGVLPQKIKMVDSKGVIYSGRTEGMNEFKTEFCVETDDRSLEDAMTNADVFLGLSTGGLLTPAMLKSMSRDPIVFALANPVPEIDYDLALDTRSDAIVGTGRSDFPNQINNVLGFPYIFRGALDVHATDINEEMKLAAALALASLAKEDVPDSVSEAYGRRRFEFGRQYLIPKPLDPRALTRVSAAVAQAAMDSGVARQAVDIPEYCQGLELRLGRTQKIVRSLIRQARIGKRCRIAYPDGTDPRVLQAAQRVVMEGIACPVLIGPEDEIRAGFEKIGFKFKERELEIIDPSKDPRQEDYAQRYYQLRRYKGLLHREAETRMDSPLHFALMMLEAGDVDGFVGGINEGYSETLRPALKIIRKQDWLTRVSGLYLISVKERLFFFADTTVNINPTPEELAEIAICAAEAAEKFGVEPRVAMLSFSTGGSVQDPESQKMADAVAVARSRYPDLCICGEMQIDVALNSGLRDEIFSESCLPKDANVLIFPNLSASNIAYKMMLAIGGADGVGPIVLGIRKPLNVIAQGSSVENIVHLSAVTVVSAHAQ